MKMRLRRLWIAPPELTVEHPHKWRGLIATCSLSGRASEAAWNELPAKPSGLLICAPSDLADLEADQRHIVCDNAEPNRPLGPLWRSAKARGGVKALSERGNPSIFVCRGRGASQLAGAVGADSAEESGFGRPLACHTSEIGLAREECDSMGPTAGRRRVAESNCSVEQIAMFTQPGV